MKYKSVIISADNESGLEDDLNELLNGKDPWHKDVGKILSISYSFNRDSKFYETMIYSALVVYETK